MARIVHAGIVSLVLVLLLSTHDLWAAGSTVRGQVYRTINAQRAPANGIAVRLNHQQRGPSIYSYTNTDGMYYLYNVPSGSYTLEITIASKQVLKYPITVLDRAYTDIAPIEIR